MPFEVKRTPIVRSLLMMGKPIKQPTLTIVNLHHRRPKMLTNAAVKAARTRAAAYKLFDQGGLHLYVAPTGRKSFRIKFRFGGKELLLTIGAVPEVSLDAARARCDQVRVQLGRGEDPRTCEIVQTGKACPFENVARQWHAHMRQRWTNVHAGDVLASLERDVFPAIGAMPIRTVTVPVILNALRVIQEGGGLVTASRSAPI
jgi:hypothetical protein